MSFAWLPIPFSIVSGPQRCLEQATQQGRQTAAGCSFFIGRVASRLKCCETLLLVLIDTMLAL